MEYFIDFINSGDYFLYIFSSYFFSAIVLIFLSLISISRVKKLKKEYAKLAKKNETKI